MSTLNSLSSKAVQQYRSRDVFAYLALRYYFSSDAARTDKWAEDNAVQIVLASPRGRYLPVRHLKSIDEKGVPEHRVIHVPSPSEALVEAFIICECATAWQSERSSQLFSYLAQERGSQGPYYDKYMHGLRRRQAAIGEACRTRKNAVVRYVDIRRFYPSITPVVANQAWGAFCRRHSISELVRTLGAKLIRNHSLETGDKSILTGPMFSHLLANIILKDVDDFAGTQPAAYFRYVDDITLVGTAQEIDGSLEVISAKLGDLGFSLHSGNPEKDFQVTTLEWLNGSSDYIDETGRDSWKSLVGSIKSFLLLNPTKAPELSDMLSVRGFRFPLPDYSKAISERSAYQKVKQLGLWRWLFSKVADQSPSSIIEAAVKLDLRYQREVHETLNKLNGLSLFERKRSISKLRYRLGRLIYIANMDALERIYTSICQIEELRFHSEIINSLITRDCSGVAALGANVAQASAQIFRATGETAVFSKPVSTVAEVQSLAVFLLNGVSVEAELRTDKNPIVNFAQFGVDRDLIVQPRGFVQELACLHGLGEPRHASVMKTAFDLDQEISLDALEFEYGYSM